MTICREAVATNDRYGVAGPIDLHQRHLLLVEPGQHIEGDAATAVQHDDPRRKVGIAFEVPILLLPLRIVGEAIPNKERPCLNSKRDAVSGEDQRVPRTLSPYHLVFRTRAALTPMPAAVRPFMIVSRA